METKQERKISPWEQQFVDFCMRFPEGEQMLDEVANSNSTRIAYSIGCKHLSDFLKKDLTEIIREYRRDIKKNMYEGFDKWEQTFKKFIVYLRKLGYKSASQKLFFAGAKALINTNVPRSLRLQAKGPKVVSRKIKGVSMDDLKKIYNMCSVREKTFIAIMKDSGISADDVIGLTLEDLEGFDKGKSWVHINMFRGKEGVEYETFAGPNAVDILKAYLNLRKRKGENITSKSPVFATERKPYKRLGRRSLSTLFTRITKKTGIIVSTHRLRKFFETYMALTVRHPIVLKYWMGHQIGAGRDIEARYVIPPTPEQLGLYKEAYKNIDLTSESMEERVKALEKFKETLTPEQRNFMQKSKIIFRKKKAKKRKTETNGGYVNNCHKIVSEKELLPLLDAGWEIVKELSNGHIVVCLKT